MCFTSALVQQCSHNAGDNDTAFHLDKVDVSWYTIYSDDVSWFVYLLRTVTEMSNILYQHSMPFEQTDWLIPFLSCPFLMIFNFDTRWIEVSPWILFLIFFNFHIFPLVNFDQDTRTQVMRWENTKVAFVKCAVATIILAFVKRHQILSSNSDRCHTTDWLIINYFNHNLLASFITALRQSIAHKLYQIFKYLLFQLTMHREKKSVLQMRFFILECYSLSGFFFTIFHGLFML